MNRLARPVALALALLLTAPVAGPPPATGKVQKFRLQEMLADELRASRGEDSAGG